MIKLIKEQFKKSLAQRFFVLIAIVFPLFSLFVLMILFAPRNPKSLPFCVVDYDNSQISRKIIRRLDALNTLDIKYCANEQEAQDRMLSIDIYGVLIIPKDYEKNLQRNNPSLLSLGVNAEFLMPSGLIYKNVYSTLEALSLEMRTQLLHRYKINYNEEPIKIETSALFNWNLDYASFLLPSLLFAVLHILLLCASSNAIASDYKSGDLYKKSNPIQTILVRTFVNMVFFVAWGIIYFFTSSNSFEHFWLVLIAIILMLGAYWFMGISLILIFRSVRMGVSSIAFISAPAFAFAGITFPLYAMPLFARSWGESLPLTHFLRILIDQTTRNAPIIYSLQSLWILCIFFVAWFLAFIALIKYRIKYVKPYIR